MSQGLRLRRSGLIAIGVIIVTAITYRLISKASEKPMIRSSFSIPVVKTGIIENKSQGLIVELSGKLVARNRIDIFSEVNGVLESADFREGNRYGKGQVLVRINDSELRTSIKSQKSQLLNSISQILPDLAIDFPDQLQTWKDFHRSVTFDKPIPEMPRISDEKLKVYLSGKNVFTNYFAIKSQEERLTKHIIYAPFSGMLSEADINSGTLVRAGQRLGSFIQPGAYELEASVSLDDLAYIHVGDEVIMRSPELAKTWKGKILRINETLDPTTQSVQVYVGVNGQELKEGQYLTAEVQGSELENVAEIPRKYLLDGDAIFFVQEDSVLTKKSVDIRYKGNEVIYIGGAKEGSVYLDQVLNSAYDGMIVHPISDNKEGA